MYYYIVYSYTFNSNFSSRFIRGIYTSYADAKKRQTNICIENGGTLKHGINNLLYTNNIVTIINRIPAGDCNVQLFTTSAFDF